VGRAGVEKATPITLTRRPVLDTGPRFLARGPPQTLRHPDHCSDTTE